MFQRAKLTFFTIAILIATFSGVSAQKFAYVDIGRILENYPDYKRAQEELDRTAEKWRQEIAQEADKVKGLHNKFQAEQVLLSDDVKKQRETELAQRENQVREMQKEKFGPDGALFKRRQELVKPIQDKIFTVIESYATEKGYDFIFDKGTGGMLFSNNTYDKTSDIQKRLGIK